MKLLISVLFISAAFAQVAQLQDSDFVSQSKTTINNNFSIVDGKITYGMSEPSIACSASQNLGKIWINTASAQAQKSVYVCSKTGTYTYEWEIPYKTSGGLQWKGNWRSDYTYAVQDVAFSGGTSYVAIVAHTNSPPPSAAWEILVSGSSGGSLTFSPPFTRSGDVIGLDQANMNLTLNTLIDGLNASSIRTGAQLALGATPNNANGALVSRDASGNFSAGTVTASLAGNASTATSLAADPADCAAGQYATSIGANGNLTCAQVAYLQLSGTPASDPIAGIAGLRTLGTGAQQAAAGNDVRLSDTRTPTDASVTLAKMAPLAANSILGNNSGVAATPLALTASQIKAMLAIAAGDVSGLAASATTDATNASNIGSGTIGAARLPAALSSSTSINGTTIPAAATLLVSGGALGTPSSATLTNATGLPLATGVIGTLPNANVPLQVKVNSVLQSGNAFTCDFSLGYTCFVDQNGQVANPIIPTLSNLPTKQHVKLVILTNNSTGVRSVAWPSNVFCARADIYQACGTVNFAAVGSGPFTTTWWSDGTNLYSTGDSGHVQTATAAHMYTADIGVYNPQTNGPGTARFLFGSVIQSNASASPTLDVTGCTGATAGVVTNQIGHINNAPSGTCTVKITFAGSLNTASNGWACVMQNITHPGATNAMYMSANTTTSVTFTGTTISGDRLVYSGCSNY